VLRYAFVLQETTMLKQRTVLLLIRVLSVIVFFFDYLTPLEYDAWIFYVFPLCLSFFLDKHGASYWVTLSLTILIMGGIFTVHVSPSNSIPIKLVLFNRSTAIIGGWILAFGIEEFKNLFKERRKLDELSHEVAEYKIEEKILNRDKEILERMVNERTQSLLQSHRELERAQRMADMGRLASTIAHELRNPLAAIRLAMHNIQRKSQNPIIDKHIETVNAKTLESESIIENLLSFTRVKSMNFERLDICALLKDCVATIAPKHANENIKLIQNLECKPDDFIEADATQFKILINNILDNAYQSLPDKSGTITLAVKRFNGSWKISIADTGTGIDEHDIKKIFEPFYTTKSKGTGLGLAVSHEIVEKHSGTIEVNSIKGKGTTFTVTLPMLKPYLNYPDPVKQII
jgi:signal transduction histidine kinase